MPNGKTSNTDGSLAKLIIEEGLAPREAVEDCLKAAREMSLEGEPTTLKELLLQFGHLTPEQAEQAERARARVGRAGATRTAAKLGDYELRAHIGKGGMANVYLARRSGGPGHIALKVIHRNLSDKPGVLERLERERRALFALEHPNIVRGLDFGCVEGRYYLAMEFVEGMTLKSYVRKHGPVPEATALDWMEQVTEALDYAHQSGFVHRDIKTRNLVLRKDGVVKILDFGLSKSLSDEDQELTQDGQMLGTVLYAAPEQLRGAKDVDCRADIYSLGITVYYLLAGHVPFRGSTTTATAALHLERHLPDLKEERPELSDGICTLVERMTRKAPEARYQNPAELLDEIRLLRHEGRVSDTEPGDPRAEPKLSGRKSVSRLWPLAAAAAMIAFLLAHTWRQPRLKEADPDYTGPIPSPATDSSTSTSSIPVAAPEPAPEAPVPEADPGEEYAKLEAAVEEHVKKAEFLSAIRLFEPVPVSLRSGDSLARTIALRERVGTSAREHLAKKRKEWLSEGSAEDLAETLRQIIAAKLQFPGDLRPEAEEIQKAVLRLHQARTLAGEVSGEAGPGDSAKPGAGGAGPSDETTAGKGPGGPAAGPLAQASPVETPRPSPSPEQVAERLFLEVATRIQDKDWPAALAAIRKLQTEFKNSETVKQRAAELAELHASAASQGASIEQFFAGEAERIGEDEVEVLYDFSDADQFRDWLPLDPNWEVAEKAVRRISGSNKGMLWWRHPHWPKFRLRFDAQGHGYLSCVVLGNGLVADSGAGLVCGLGHYGGNKAVIRTNPKNLLESEVHQVNPAVVYPIDALVSKGLFLFRSGGEVKLKLNIVSDVKGRWGTPGLGGWLRLGILGWREMANTYSNIRIRTKLSPEWIELERARIRARLRARAGLLQKNFALKFDGRRSYAVIPPSATASLTPPFTLELRFLPRAIKTKEYRGTLVSFGLAEESLLALVKVGREDCQIGLQLGSAREQPTTALDLDWHHVAVVYDGEIATLFMDGKRLRREIRVRHFDSRREPVLLGYGSFGAYKGLIDDVRISNTTRYEDVFQPPAELVPDGSTVLLLDCNEGEGNTANDRGKSGTHARLYGAGFEAAEAEGEE